MIKNISPFNVVLLTLCIILLGGIIRNGYVIRQLEKQNSEIHYTIHTSLKKVTRKKIDSIYLYDNRLVEQMDSLSKYYEKNPIVLPHDTFDFREWARERYGNAY
jgi:hypothetical protein